jgi:hypothetical protein
MKQDFKIQGLSKLGISSTVFTKFRRRLFIRRSRIISSYEKERGRKPLVYKENQRFCFKNWADILKKKI